MDIIIECKRGGGTTVYRVQLVIKSKGRIVYHGSETFTRRNTAEAWMERREKAGAMGRPKSQALRSMGRTA